MRIKDLAEVTTADAATTYLVADVLVGADPSTRKIKLANLFSASGWTIGGNLNLVGSGDRITGLFSTSAYNSRVLFQDTLGNGNTYVGAIPNTTSNSSGYNAFNANDSANSSYVGIAITATNAMLSSDKLGTGTYLPLDFYTSATKRMTLDTAGNLGVGVVPSGWNTSSNVIEFAGGTAMSYLTTQMNIIQNAYFSAAGQWIYKNTGYATGYRQNGGVQYWEIAPSGTAGNVITFTQAMMLDASGNLGLGVTPSAWGTVASQYKAIQLGVTGFVAGRAGNEIILVGSNGYVDSGNTWRYVASGNYASFYQQASGQHQWYTAPSGTAGNAITFTTAMTLDASGNLGIGITPTAKLQVQGVNAGSICGLFSTTVAVTAVGNGVRGALVDFGTGAGIFSNWYYNVTDKRAATGYSPKISLHTDSGDIAFYTSATGAADSALGWTEVGRFTQAGNLGIGTASPYTRFVTTMAVTPSSTVVNETADFAAQFVIGANTSSTFGDRIPLVFNLGNATTLNHISAAIVGERETTGWNTAISFWTNNITSGPEGTDAIQEKMRLDSAGNLLVGITSAVANAGVIQTKNGIGFPAIQVACSDANTLDDYEEGTFTPTIVGTTTGGVGTYTAQTGTYTKIGRVVYYKCYMNWTAHTGTGSMNIAGLPFTSASSANTFSACTVYVDIGLSLTASNVIQGYVNTASSQVVLTQYPAGGGSATLITLDTAAAIMVSGYYDV